jgi:flagellin-like protein
MTKKGITPIIAIIVLLLIVVALSGIAYTYISGVVTTQTEESFTVQTGGIYCDDVGGVSQIRLLIRNLGISASITDTSFILATVDGTDISSYITLDPTSIGPSEVGELTTTCGGDCGSGSHTVRLSTSANTQSTTVICS